MISQPKDAIPAMILTAFVVTATSTFSKEALIQLQEWSARDFVSKLRFGNRRNPLRISRFSNRQVGAKDPLSAAADLFRGSLGLPEAS